MEQAAKLDELRRRSVAEGDTLRGKVNSTLTLALIPTLARTLTRPYP